MTVHRYPATGPGAESAVTRASSPAAPAGSPAHRATLRPGPTCAAAWICVLLLAGGCDDSVEVKSTNSDLSNAVIAALEARGGEVETVYQAPPVDTIAGTGGDGGTIRVESSTGDVLIDDGPPGFPPPDPLGAGALGIDVPSGTTVLIRGDHVVDFVRVRAGGNLQLMGDTYIEVTDDVEVSGRILSNRAAQDGYDLTISAGGVVSITGRIDLSGRDNVQSDDLVFVGGGNGGNLHLSAGRSTDDDGIPKLWVTGVIDTRGGNADLSGSNDVLFNAGNGGRISLGARGRITLAGKITSSAGRIGFNDVGNTPASAGDIRVTALGDIEIANATRIVATGGGSVGRVAGLGGTIEILAPIGIVDIRDTNLDVRGGDALHASLALSGAGGAVRVYGNVVELDGMIVDASGGAPGPLTDFIGRTRVLGSGGSGGVIRVVASGGLVAQDDVTIRANGGDTTAIDAPLGTGGEVSIVNVDESNLLAMAFFGTVEAQGGRGPFGNRLGDGTICHRGANALSLRALTGANQFPLGLCPVDINGALTDLGFAIQDLDCANASLFPSVSQKEIPVVTGVDFFRFHVAEGTTSVIVTTRPTGAEGNIDIYAGEANLLGTLDLDAYRFQSTTANDSDESLEITLDEDFRFGEFITVLVFEKGAFVEPYEISVSCTPDPDNG